MTLVKMASTIWMSPILRGVKVWFVKEIVLLVVLEDKLKWDHPYKISQEKLNHCVFFSL